MTFRARSSPRPAAFTLVEVLVSMAVILILLVVLVQITDATKRAWTFTSGKVEQFREARIAFESVTRRLSQATLNTYWDYEKDSAGNPTQYIRQSELRFISGPAQVLNVTTDGLNPGHAIFFQAPLGYVEDPQYAQLQNLLNTWGYYVQWGTDEASRPAFITNKMVPLRYRFRLMELMEPSEALSLYNLEAMAGGASNYNDRHWFIDPIAVAATSTKPPRTRVLADNILMLVLQPALSPQEMTADPTLVLAPNYLYDSTTHGEDIAYGTATSAANDPKRALDSKNQLPPLVRVTLTALDETTFNRFEMTNGAMMPNWLDGRFSQVSNNKADQDALEKTLRDKHLIYRTFTTTVPIKGAKWSRQ